MKSNQMKIGEIRVGGTSAYVARRSVPKARIHRCEECILFSNTGYCQRSIRQKQLGACNCTQNGSLIYFTKPTIEEMIDWMLENHWRTTNTMPRIEIELSGTGKTKVLIYGNCYGPACGTSQYSKKTYRAIELLFVHLYKIKQKEEGK